jgi:hypothetical protein
MVIYPMLALVAACETEECHSIGLLSIVTRESTELDNREYSLSSFDMNTSNDEQMTFSRSQGCSAPA